MCWTWNVVEVVVHPNRIEAGTFRTHGDIHCRLPLLRGGRNPDEFHLPALRDEDAEGDRRMVDARHSGRSPVAFFVVPSAMAFLALGDVLVGALLQTGRFTRADSVYVWGILAGSAVGL